MTKRTKKTEAVETVVSIKGFDLNWQCRGFQYEIGKTYEMDGPIEACERGFHAIEGYPLEVFDYYPPSTSRYAEVLQSGDLARHSDDSKLASAKIAISAEIHLHDLIQRAVKWVFDRAKPEGEGSQATGDRGAASATGDRGAASATGEQGAASATGWLGAASATGAQGAAMSCGFYGRARGADGNALFLTRRADDGMITHVWAGIVGRDGVQADTWYTLNETGQPEVVT